MAALRNENKIPCKCNVLTVLLPLPFSAFLLAAPLLSRVGLPYQGRENWPETPVQIDLLSLLLLFSARPLVPSDFPNI